MIKIKNLNIFIHQISIFFRVKKVHDGVTHAAKLYPNAYLVMVLVGTLKGRKIVHKLNEPIFKLRKNCILI